ncbi:MAG TPA: acetyl-CoA carboxylase biotin carboxyl carrier protein [Bacteroidota bacterium]|nr:acetyl-CoA carboxylase biotin carboxyl carrier protein [Bacteroidota bacterium]
MDLQYVRKLVKLLSESAVDEIEIEEEGTKIRVARNSHGVQVVAPPAFQLQGPASQVPVSQGMAPTAPGASAPSPAPVQQAESSSPPPGLHEIKSPIVGTFYRSPAPDAAPFVQVGSVIRPGAVLCIVEAMKLMNEIEADVAGKIVRVMVENGQPVEYDQTLFLVEKA